MYNGPFDPTLGGYTIVVGSTAATQVASPTNTGIVPPSYRVRNTASTQSYLTWGVSSTITAAAVTSSATTGINTLGMVGNSVEVFKLPQGAWYIASSTGSFEITAGEGI